MRGRELLQLIKSLTSREKAFVRASFATEKNGEELSTLFDGMLRLKTFNKKLLSKSSKITERRISSLLPSFGRLVVRSVGNFQPKEPSDFELELNTAWKMVMRLKNAPAAVIMQDLFQRAIAVERFDILLELYELNDVMTEPIELPGPGRDAIVQMQRNLVGYEDLRMAFLRIKFGTPADRQRTLEYAGRSDLLNSEKDALSIRAKALYFWLKTRQFFWQNDLESASKYQERIIGLLRDHEWLKRERDYFLLKEYEPLIGFLFAADRKEEANSAIFRVGNMPTQQAREELMKWHQIFPLRLSVALYEGDAERGEAAIHDFEEILKKHQDILPRKFVTKNQYWIACFLLAKGEFKAARRTTIQLLKEARSADFEPIYLPMTRILASVLSFETGDHEDLSWQEKTFRMTNAYQETPFYKTTLTLLRKLANAKSDIHRQSILQEYQQLATEMESDSALLRYMRFFDLESWISSKQRKCSMLEVFESRAMSSGSAEQNSSIRAQNQ